MAYPEPQYHKQETAKEYTKQYNLEEIDSVITRQEDGLMGYISAGQFATTGSNTFTGNQIMNSDLIIDGDIYANQFIVTTSSVNHFTASTNFGLDSGDTHTFTGSVKITGSLDVIGGIAGEINATNGIISSSTQIKNYGDFATTGSNVFIGNQIITGSLLVSGSTTQIGNNTLIGNTVLSGSIEVSGSQTFRGIQITSGTQFITGSSTQIGDTTLTGNNTITGSNYILGTTVMSGSLEISGSQTRYGVTRNFGEWHLSGSMTTTGSTTITGDTHIGGNLTLSGSIEVSGSFTGSLQIDGDINLASPHNFYRWGNRLFNYANYYNTGSIDLVSGSATRLSYTSDIESGFTLVSGSQIRASYTGYYNIQFSVQLQKPGAQPADVQIWYSKNGQSIPYTNSVFTLPFKSNLIAALNFFVPMNAGDYIELNATTNDSTVDAVTIPANGITPASPSVVVTISQVS